MLQSYIDASITDINKQSDTYYKVLLSIIHKLALLYQEAKTQKTDSCMSTPMHTLSEYLRGNAMSTKHRQNILGYEIDHAIECTNEILFRPRIESKMDRDYQQCVTTQERLSTWESTPAPAMQHAHITMQQPTREQAYQAMHTDHSKYEPSNLSFTQIYDNYGEQ